MLNKVRRLKDVRTRYASTGEKAMLCWRNGVKEREKVAELPPGLDELWGGEELAWGLAGK